MSSLYGIIGQSVPNYLLADPLNGTPVAIPMEPGNGIVKRGTVAFRKPTGFWAPAEAGDIVNTNLFAVMNEEIDTGSAPSSGETAIAENAAAYRTGCFIDGRVTLKNDAALGAGHKVVLARQGIFFNVSESAGEFENGVTGK